MSLLRNALAFCLILLVRAYQLVLSPFFGGQCRFYPSCSQYMILSIKKHGPLCGTGKGLWRLCKCHPWHPGGFDYP